MISGDYFLFFFVLFFTRVKEDTTQDMVFAMWLTNGDRMAVHTKYSAAKVLFCVLKLLAVHY